MKNIDDLFKRLSDRGQGAYGLSDVSQLEHALQAADLAVERNMGDCFVLAALFHDIGHLVVPNDVDLAADGIDDRHELSGARLLERFFGRSVSEPVRLHVAAKRYLCAVEPDYFDCLSVDSVRSLELQGGPMSTAEAQHFAELPHAKAAMELRRIDDEAKVSGLKTSMLDDFRKLAV